MSIAAAQAEPLIEGVQFTDDKLIVELSDGRILGTPIRWYPRLERASPEQRNRWELLGPGIGIHWPEIDEDLSLDGMLAGRAAPGVVK